MLLSPVHRPFNNFWSCQEYIVTLVFLIDLVMKFFVSYTDPETGLPMSHLKDIGRHYMLR